MTVNAAIYGYTKDKRSYFGVWMKYDKHEQLRVVPLKSGSKNQAELHALDFVISSMHDKEMDIDIVTSNLYSAKVLLKDDGKYKMKPEKNVELIELIRKKANSGTIIRHMKDDENLAAIQELTKRKAKSVK